MAKSIKLKNNTYLDTKGIVHNRELLSDILNKQDISNIVCIVGAKNNIDLPAGQGVRVTGLDKIKDPLNMLSNDYIVIPKSGNYLIGYSMRLGDLTNQVGDVFTSLRTENSQLYRLCSMWQTQHNRLSPSQTAIVPLKAGDKLYLEITSITLTNYVYGGNSENTNGCYIFCKYLGN